MKKFLKSLMGVSAWILVFVCVFTSVNTLSESLSRHNSSLADKIGVEYVSSASASDDMNGEALLSFYKDKVDKLNKQCNVLLIICVLLLAALIISRLIQPQQSIYEVDGDEKKKPKTSKNTDEKRADIYDDAMNSDDSEEVYTINKEVSEELRDISEN